MKSIFALGIAACFLLVAYVVLLIPLTPSIQDLRKAKAEQPSILLSADGKELAVYKRFNREWVPLDRISPNVIKALIATEDHRFYAHYGIEPRRIAAGAVRTLMGDTEGGSTITQQLARNMYPNEIGRERTISRKLKEMVTALKIEQTYTKDEILETYLNTVPFLYNAFGIEMAARTYFDKPASKLNVLESATLIGMLKGTSYYNPVLNPERAIKRRNVVLSQMVKRDVLSRAEFDKLKKRPMRLDFERQPEALGSAPHLAQHLRKWLIDWADRKDYNLYSDGLVIHTTIDSKLQQFANRAVDRQMDGLQAVANVEWSRRSGKLLSTNVNPYISEHRRIDPFAHFWSEKNGLLDTFIRESSAYRRAIEAGTAADEAFAQLMADAEFIARLRTDKTRLQTGFVAMDPTTAHVKAWVGSRDFTTDQFDHVAQARRQPGSTFKPFVYGAALEGGMSPNKKFIDEAIEIAMPDGTVWRPSDSSSPSGRAMTVREGLVYSKNTIAARVMQETTPKKAARLAHEMGVNQSELHPVPALALGTSPVTPLEMVSAYSTIARGGEYRKPVLITRITDKDGNVLASFDSENVRVMSTESSEQLIDMMRGVVNQGTGQAIRSRFGIRADVAGKTGTTQNNTDGWFILMHPRLVAGAWVGFNDPRVTMRSDHWGQGKHNALLPVGDFFQQTLNARLIDSRAEFPKANDSLFAPIFDFFEQWFGEERPANAAGEHSEEKQQEKGQQDQEDKPLSDYVEEFIRQAREFEKTVREWLIRIEKSIEWFQKTIERFSG
jgi:penicillin-binding protein 1A